MRLGTLSEVVRTDERQCSGSATACSRNANRSKPHPACGWTSDLTSPNPIFPNGFEDGTQKIAAGWVGAIIGYWLA